MASRSFSFADLDLRRRQLGMSVAALAQASGVSIPVVQRILSGKHPTASFRNVRWIADALGLGVSFLPRIKVVSLREQADAKARRIVKMVQGTMGLEGQAVDEQTINKMIKRTTRELLRSNRKLWSP